MKPKTWLNLIKELDVFTDDAITKFENKKLALNQLYRNFLLAEVYGRKQGYKEVFSVILAPKDQPTTKHEITLLKDNLKQESRHRILAITLEDFFENIRHLCSEEFAEWNYWFQDRYLNFGKLITGNWLKKVIMENKNNKSLLFKSEDEKISIDVHFEGETVWLTQEQMSVLFGKGRAQLQNI